MIRIIRPKMGTYRCRHCRAEALEHNQAILRTYLSADAPTTLKELDARMCADGYGCSGPGSDESSQYGVNTNWLRPILEADPVVGWATQGRNLARGYRLTGDLPAPRAKAPGHTHNGEAAGADR